MFPLLLTSRSLVRRLSTSLVASTPLSVSVFASSRVQSRRTLFTTSRLALAAPDTTDAAPSPSVRPKSKLKSGRTSSSTPRKSSSATTTQKAVKTRKAVSRKTAQKARPKKKKAAAKTAAKKPKINFAKLHKPPKPPPNPYLLFFVEQLRNEHVTRENLHTLAASASHTWHGYNIGQKQPYFDRYKELREEFVKKREEYYKNVDSSFLKQLNRHRVSQGKYKIHRPRREPGERQPTSGFFRFLTAFRLSTEARAIITEGTKDGKAAARRLAVVCGERWRSLPEEQRAAYNKEAREEKELWKARQANKT